MELNKDYWIKWGTHNCIRGTLLGLSESPPMYTKEKLAVVKTKYGVLCIRQEAILSECTTPCIRKWWQFWKERE